MSSAQQVEAGQAYSRSVARERETLPRPIAWAPLADASGRLADLLFVSHADPAWGPRWPLLTVYSVVALALLLGVYTSRTVARYGSLALAVVDIPIITVAQGTAALAAPDVDASMIVAFAIALYVLVV